MAELITTRVAPAKECKVMSKRAIRRHHETRIRAKYRTLHLNNWYDEDHSDCWCTKNPGHYYSRNPFSCGCSKRRKGRPKVADGMCKVNARDRVYVWRSQCRYLNHAVYSDWNCDKATLLTDAKVFNKWSW